MAKVSPQFTSLTEDWARAAFALIQKTRFANEIEPASVSLMLSVLVDHKIKEEKRKALKAEGAIFEHHDTIIPAIDEAVEALRQHAPKRALIFEKLGESYRAALSNSDTFVIPDEFHDIDFTKPVAPTPRKKDPNSKLPQKVLDDWGNATLSQMEGAGHEITSTHRTALDENLLVIRANFGQMTQRQFDDEKNEPAIMDVLDQITGEPHVTIAAYMKQAI